MEIVTYYLALNTARRDFDDDDSDQEQVTLENIPEDTTRRQTKKRATKAPARPAKRTKKDGKQCYKP